MTSPKDVRLQNRLSLPNRGSPYEPSSPKASESHVYVSFNDLMPFKGIFVSAAIFDVFGYQSRFQGLSSLAVGRNETLGTRLFGYPQMKIQHAEL